MSKELVVDKDVMTSLCGLFVQVVANNDVNARDIVGMMNKYLQNATGDLENGIKAQKGVIEKFETALIRLKTKDENNPFVAAANNQIQSCNLAISKIQHQIDMGNAGIEFLKAFSYEFDQAAADALRIRRGSGQFVVFDESELGDEEALSKHGGKN